MQHRTAVGLARELAPAVAVFAVSRVVVGVALAIAPVVAPGYDRGDFFLDWDAAHYFTVAEDGYPPLHPPGGGYLAHSAFFPLLPWLARWLDVATPLSLRQSAFVVANAAALGAAVALWFLARATLGGEAKATRAVALVVLWPASLVLSMFYSDGLLLLLVSISLLALLRERWVLAGVAAMLATASRPNAIAIAVACGWAAVVAARRTRSIRPFIAPALAPLGMLGYFTFLEIRLGDFFLWFKAEEEGWGGGFDFGNHFVTTLLDDGLRNPTARFDLLLSGVAGLVGLGLLVWAVRARLPTEQLLYAGVVLVLALGASFGASIPRYVMNAFPIFLAPAARLPEGAAQAWLSVSAAALACLTLVVATTRVVTP